MIIDSPIISGSTSATGSLNQVGNVVITGSLTVTGPISGALTGSVDSASYAASATSASYAVSATSSSYAINASYLNNSGSGEFVPTGSFNTFSSSILTYTGSNNTNISNIHSTTASLNTFTGSASSRLSSIESTTGSLNTASGSAITRLNSIESTTGSLNSYTASNDATVTSVAAAAVSAVAGVNALAARTGSYTLTSSFNNYTASNNTTMSCVSSTATSALVGVGTLASQTGSYATTGSNTFVGGQYLSSSFNPTGFSTTASLYTDGGLRVGRDAYISGTLYLNNVTVYGTQSVCFITSSQLNIASNIISVNTATPSVRFGGLSVYDSGSTGLTGSLLWDSEDNQWIYSNPSGSTYDSAMFLVGPRNTGVLGGEVGISCNFLSKGNGMHHMTSSGIFEDGSRTCFYNSGFITNAGVSCFTTSCAASIVGGTVSGTTGTFSGTVQAATLTDGFITIGAAQINRTSATVEMQFAGSGDVRIFGNTAYPIRFIAGTGAATFSNALQVAGQQAAANYGGTGLNFDFTSGNVGRIASVKTTSGGSSLELHTYNTSGADVTALTINSNGISCFACQVCAPSFVGGTVSGTTGTFSGNVGINGGLTSSPLTIKVATNQNVRVSSETSTSIQAVNDAANAYVALKVDGSCLLLNTQSGGNVGIGTSTPEAKLQVYGNMQIYAGSSGNSDPLIFGGETGASKKAIFLENFWMVYQGHDNEGHKFRSVSASGACTDDMIITGGGNVSIGTNTPSSTYGRLTVAGTGISIADDGNAKLQIGRYSSTVCNAYIKMGTNACSLRFTNAADTADIVVMEKGGFVGINTSSPGYIFHIKSNANGGGLALERSTGGADTIIRFKNENNVDRAKILFGGSVEELGFYPGDGNTEAMRITSTGITCFSSTVCAPAFRGGTFNGTSITGTSVTVATDCSGVIVDVAGRHGLMKYFNFSTGFVGACSGTDGSISTWLGRFAGSITAPTAVYQDLRMFNSGIAAFSCQICTPYVSTNTVDVGGSATSPSSACIGYGMFGYSGVGLAISAGATGANQGVGFFVCGVERGRWITNGNLGVGTVCPLVRLDVVGSMYVRSGTFYTDTIAGYTTGAITSTASILPNTNGTLDLGSSSNRWCTVYTSDLSLNNGIGNYTIVEGENDLFLYNNNSCKVFKFVVQEVCPEIAPAKRSI